MNQKFRVHEIDGRKKVQVEDSILDAHLSPKILTSINVDNICIGIFTATDHGLGVEETFDEMVRRLSFACEHGGTVPPAQIFLASAPVSSSATTSDLNVLLLDPIYNLK